MKIFYNWSEPWSFIQFIIQFFWVILFTFLNPHTLTPPSPHLFCLNIFLQALFTNSSIDERVEPVEEEEEEEDHTYELLLTAQTKVPSLKQDFQSNKGKY